MTGAEFIAKLLADGSPLGLRAGDGPEAAERAVPVGFLDVEEVPGASLRRDHGLLELSFSGGGETAGWTLSSGVLELHRLPLDPGPGTEWREATGVDFAPYTAWSEVEAALAAVPGHPEPVLELIHQGGYLEYRNPASGVSVLVVDDPDEERDEWPGNGDVWSVGFGGTGKW
ncbi:hypothetical protein [Streptomyces sp. NPDC089799]|uniref:hypothetical protein n=1 Tax=Streptomyces sp. NPDC089799 TaxID=3155066 RepID=UPI003421FFC3